MLLLDRIFNGIWYRPYPSRAQMLLVGKHLLNEYDDKDARRLHLGRRRRLRGLKI